MIPIQHNIKIEGKIAIYIAGGLRYTNYTNWLPNSWICSSIKNSDLVLFAGGEDVDPTMYDEPRGISTQSNINRDWSEAKIFEKAKALDKPILGICRGSQFICALSGGRLVQHQQNPFSIHPITTIEGDEIPITSTHHQAQYPYDMPSEDYKLLAWTEDISKYHLDGNNIEISKKPFKEAEIVYYNKYNALGIQGHPEMMFLKKDKYSETFDYLNTLVDKLLNKKL